MFTSLKLCTVRGFTGTRKEICYKFNVDYNIVRSRMYANHMTFEQSVEYYIDNGVKQYNQIYEIMGFSGTRREICKYFNISRNAVSCRMRRANEDFETAFNHVFNRNNNN